MSLTKNSLPVFLYSLVITITVGIVLWSISTGELTKKELSVAFLAGLSTFLGALFAFRLNENKDLLKQRSDQKAALSRALFIITRQGNAINSIVNLLKDYESEIERAVNLPAFKTPSYSDLKHNFEDLEFLLETEYINLLMRLTIEQERFYQGFESLNIRNDFYVQEVLPQLALKSLRGKNLTDKEISDALGERIFETSINYANNLYYLIFKNQSSINQIHSELYKAAKAMFPNEKFIIPFEDN